MKPFDILKIRFASEYPFYHCAVVVPDHDRGRGVIGEHRQVSIDEDLLELCSFARGGYIGPAALFVS